MATDEELLAAAKQAKLDILERGQKVETDGEVLVRPALETVQKVIDDDEARSARKARGGMRMRRGVPL